MWTDDGFKKIQHGKLLGYLRHLVYRDCVFSQKFALRLNKLEVLDACQKLRKFWILILVWQATSYKQERKERNKRKWILELSQGQREIGRRPVLFSLAPTGEALYPLSIVYVWSIHVCFLSRCLNDCFVVWMTGCFMFHVKKKKKKWLKLYLLNHSQFAQLRLRGPSL